MHVEMKRRALSLVLRPAATFMQASVFDTCQGPRAYNAYAASKRRTDLLPGIFERYWSDLLGSLSSQECSARSNVTRAPPRSRFSRRCAACGNRPHHVAVHDRETFIVVMAKEFRQLSCRQGGEALVDALQTSPHSKVDLAATPLALPVRGVSL